MVEPHCGCWELNLDPLEEQQEHWSHLSSPWLPVFMVYVLLSTVYHVGGGRYNFSPQKATQ